MVILSSSVQRSTDDDFDRERRVREQLAEPPQLHQLHAGTNRRLPHRVDVDLQAGLQRTTAVFVLEEGRIIVRRVLGLCERQRRRRGRVSSKRRCGGRGLQGARRAAASKSRGRQPDRGCCCRPGTPAGSISFLQGSDLMRSRRTRVIARMSADSISRSKSSFSTSTSSGLQRKPMARSKSKRALASQSGSRMRGSSRREGENSSGARRAHDMMTRAAHLRSRAWLPFALGCAGRAGYQAETASFPTSVHNRGGVAWWRSE